jgi:hypothetical protein
MSSPSLLRPSSTQHQRPNPRPRPRPQRQVRLCHARSLAGRPLQAALSCGSPYPTYYSVRVEHSPLILSLSVKALLQAKGATVRSDGIEVKGTGNSHKNPLYIRHYSSILIHLVRDKNIPEEISKARTAIGPWHVDRCSDENVMTRVWLCHQSRHVTVSFVHKTEPEHHGSMYPSILHSTSLLLTPRSHCTLNSKGFDCIGTS